VRALGDGKDPTIPALQLAITISGPDNKNIGAWMTGKQMLLADICDYPYNKLDTFTIRPLIGEILTNCQPTASPLANGPE